GVGGGRVGDRGRRARGNGVGGRAVQALAGIEPGVEVADRAGGRTGDGGLVVVDDDRPQHAHGARVGDAVFVVDEAAGAGVRRLERRLHQGQAGGAVVRG